MTALRRIGLYRRTPDTESTCWGENQDGVMRDEFDKKPFSTEFSFTRFLVPHLNQYEGFALFMDCDMFFMGDPCELFHKYATIDAPPLQVVKHDYTNTSNTKMYGCPQTNYSRKNWSSFMLWNCGHPSNLNLTVDEIKDLIIRGSKKSDIAFVEVGGTVGDIESLPFLESIRQFSLDLGKSKAILVHLTLLPYINVTNEIKTKPTQHSVKELRSIGIQPDILLCRGRNPINQAMKNKLALFTNVSKDSVFSAVDAKSIYDIPILFKEQKIDDCIIKNLGIKTKRLNLKPWNDYRSKVSKCKNKCQREIIR